MRVFDRRSGPARLLSRLDSAPDSLLPALLAPAGALFAMGASLRRRLVRDRPLPLAPPSLGIGNLRVGGSGKTPVVEDLGRRLAQEGQRVAVLTRGYRSGGGGDEPDWLGQAGLEVFADADRARGWKRAAASGATRILLDDALQTRHRPRWTAAILLDRDLIRPPRPLPAGPAREGAAGLERAQVRLVRREMAESIVLSGPALGFRLVPDHFLNAGGERCAQPQGPGVLFSGLARPESFESDAARTGMDLRASWREDDHWSPARTDRSELEAFAGAHGASWILVPEKNLSRVASLGLDCPVHALHSRIEWDERVDPLVWLRSHGIAI